MALSVLVIDDEQDIRDLISDILVDAKFLVRTAPNSSNAFDLINEKVPFAVILDIWLRDSDLDGLSILEIIKKKYPLLPVIVISGHGTISTAVTAIKMGAFDYIEKPFTQEKLLIVLKRACESAKLQKENLELRSRIIDKDEIIGESQTICKIKSEVDRIAPTCSRIMISGPVGSGKELIAKLIHKKSKYSSGPFVIYNPNGILPGNIKNSLFGVSTNNSNDDSEKLNSDYSLIESAHNGTLYIDEVEKLSAETQEKLLKFIKDPIIEFNGKQKKINVRIIASNNNDLITQVKHGSFNKDLYYRLSVVPISVPSLSERKEDVKPLVEYFTEYLSRSSGLAHKTFGEDAIISLQSYKWPGNIRQLKNVIEWTLIMSPKTDENIIRSDMLPPEILQESAISKSDNNIDLMSMPLREAREIFERQYLAAQMNRFNNNISKTSIFVGMERSALHRKLKVLKIHNNNCSINEENELNIAEEGLA